MSAPELVVTRGLPASGKTTFARAWVAKDRARRVRVNRDDLRAMIDDGEFVPGVTEARILAARDALIGQFLGCGISVVVDETTLPERVLEALGRLAQEHRARLVIKDLRDVTADECIRRDAAREHPVGAAVIRKLARTGQARSAGAGP